MGLHRRLLVCLILAAAPASAVTVNLVTNPDFAGSLSGWVAPFAAFDGAHSATADGTGSALGSFTLPNDAAYGNANAIEQCVTGIVPGTVYFFGGKVLIPGGQTGTGGGSVIVQWYGAPDCTNFVNNSDTPIAITPTDATDVWHALQADAVAPPTTSSALVIGEIQNNAGAGNAFAVNFDEFYLQTEPPVTPVTVPAATPLSLGLLAISLAAAALPFLRRG
jgi:hypothetical protein